MGHVEWIYNYVIVTVWCFLPRGGGGGGGVVESVLGLGYAAMILNWGHIRWRSSTSGILATT